MPIPNTNAKVFVPTLIMLSLFLAACSTSAPAASPSPESQAPTTSPVAMEAAPAATEMPAPIETTDEAGASIHQQVVKYNNPAGGDLVGFELTVDETGTITAAETEILADPGHATSVTMQTNFAQALSGEVVGKKLADLEIDRIGGASLTTGAFEKFLTDIQS